MNTLSPPTRRLGGRRCAHALALAALALGLSPEAGAQSQSGTSAATFLEIPVGARATAMGGAFGATASDASALYWNPAGTSRMTGAQVAFEYASWMEGIDHNFAAVVMPTRLGTVGVALQAMTVPEMEVVEELQNDQLPTGQTFTAGSYAVTLSYSRALTDRFSLGGNVKVLREQIADASANGVAFDVGTLFTTPFRGVRLGASILNFGTKMQMGGPELNIDFDPDPNQSGNNPNIPGTIQTDRFDLPLMARVGLATELYQAGSTRLSVAADALAPSAGEQHVNLGAELALLGGLVQLRGGYQELFYDTSPRSYTLGAGLRYAFGGLDLSADYAYEAFEYFDGVNRFSVSLQF